MMVNFTDDVSLVGRGKRLHSINLVAAAGASTVNIRRGSLSGAIVFSIPLAANEKFLFDWSNPEFISEGISSSAPRLSRSAPPSPTSGATMTTRRRPARQRAGGWP